MTRAPMCAIAIAFALSLTACHKKADKDKTETAAANTAPTVLTEDMTTKPLYDALLYPARVEAGAQAAVLSETDGVVTGIKTSLGRSVKKGDTLFTIENPDPVYRYAPIAVTAPVDGVISFLDASVGNRVERTRKLAVIADIRDVKVLIEATSSDLASLKVGQTGSLALNEKTIPVRVAAISPVIDAATGTATVELKPAKGDRPTPGAIGRVEFRIHERQGFQLPDQAIVYKGNDPFVRVVAGDKAAWRPIKLGASVGGVTEILSGIKAGDSVIVRASAFIADGDMIQVQAARKNEVARP